MTVTTTGSTGRTLREAMLCSATTISAATSIESTHMCGIAACPPRPLTTMSNWSAQAISGPGRIANSPTGSPGRLCMPNTRWMPKRSIRPSSIIASAPAPPSSAGWKISATVPSKSRESASARAAPSSIAVCPS